MPSIDLSGTVREGELGILLLLHARNRELLERWLDDDITTLSVDDDEPVPPAFDVCVLDAAAYAKHHESLVEAKRRAEPVFLPYLLVVRERNRGGLPPDMRELVDEVLVIPANPTEFAIRLSGLLRARRQSLELSEQKEREIATLERQNEQLEQFASIVSHDLRNPMTVMSGALDLLAEGDAQEEYVEMGRDALDRMEALTEGLLGLARQGQSIHETCEVDLETVARQAWALSDSGQGTLVVDGTCTLTADRERLSALFENLFRNAQEHGASESGGGVVVHLGPIHSPRGFYVEDDGPGIPPDVREQVLEYGFSTDTDGTGFGLAIVRSVAEAHGWGIRVTESESGGARVEFDVR